MKWIYATFAKPSLLGDVAAFRATGETGIEYSIMEAPHRKRRFGLVWSDRRHGGLTVGITGKGPDLAPLVAKAEAMERER